ncbi:hypothetical protein HY385_00360 [Candidatus Daviesbacteria bacterium]|nr:hypothetical protein [Candidatus Daviesbacteria bacterium]
MNNQRGVIHLLPLLLVVLVISLVALVFTGFIKLPSSSLVPKLTTSKEPTVALQNQYQNPFDKNAQYLNPFQAYKNPFDALKQAKE